jgi:hypothetical protein
VTVEEVVGRLAEQELAGQPEGTVRRPEGWLRGARASIQEDAGHRIAELIAAHPTWTVGEVADAVLLERSRVPCPESGELWSVAERCAGRVLVRRPDGRSRPPDPEERRLLAALFSLAAPTGAQPIEVDRFVLERMAGLRRADLVVLLGSLAARCDEIDLLAVTPKTATVRVTPPRRPSLPPVRGETR